MCRLPKANQRENKREIIKMKTIVFRWLSEDDKWVRKSLMITMAPAVDVWKDQRRIFSRIIFQLTISRLPAVTSITIIIRFLTFSTSCRLTCSSILLWWRLTRSLSLSFSLLFSFHYSTPSWPTRKENDREWMQRMPTVHIDLNRRCRRAWKTLKRLSIHSSCSLDLLLIVIWNWRHSIIVFPLILGILFNNRRDQVNQQDETLSLCLLISSLARANEAWGNIWLCVNVHLQLSHAQIRITNDLILTADVHNFQV